MPKWEARWHRWIDRFGVMRSQIVDRAPKQQAHKLTIVGDLMAEVAHYQKEPSNIQKSEELIGVLPGSKPAKLAQGLPFLLAVAERIWHDRPAGSVCNSGCADVRSANPCSICRPATKPNFASG